MPQVALMIAPHVQEKMKSKISELGTALIADVEEVFGLKEKNDVAFSALNLACVIGEADVQVEVRYTAGEDEYQRGKPFNPSKGEKEKLIEAMSKTLRRVLNGIADSASIWPIPIRESEFSEVYIYPRGFKDIDDAPEEVKLTVMWGDPPIKPEFGIAIRMGKIWYIGSDPNPHANGRQCAKPVAWHPK